MTANRGRTIEIELLSPKQSDEKLEESLEKFAVKWRRAIDAGYMVCVPDNPMGNLAFQCTELIEELALPCPPGRVSVHLNTFHTKEDLDGILETMIRLGIRHLLIISGDGAVRLPKLRGEDIGQDVESVTSVELIRHVRREYAGCFDVGAAYNPYEPVEHEREKMRRKIDAGAEFIITQPIIADHPEMDTILGFGLPVTVECWMSRKLHLLSDCVGYEIPEDTPYDPLENLRALMLRYPRCGVYLAICGFKTQFHLLGELFDDVERRIASGETGKVNQ